MIVGSSADIIQIIYDGLNTSAKQLGYNVVINLFEWKAVFNEQSRPIICLIPESINTFAPPNPNGSDLQGEECFMLVRFWASSLDGLLLSRAFFRQYTQVITKGWMEYFDYTYDQVEQDQYGIMANWRVAVKSQLPPFTQIYDLTLVTDTSGIADDPPIVK